MPERFELTEEHVQLLGRANIRWYHCEAGGPGLDCKRPFGNSDVEGDVCEILGWTPAWDEDDGSWSDDQRARATEVFSQIATALQVILACRTFEPGVYVKTVSYDDTSWRPADVPRAR